MALSCSGAACSQQAEQGGIGCYGFGCKVSDLSLSSQTLWLTAMLSDARLRNVYSVCCQNSKAVLPRV
jgi:hypothetical protein